jgi:phosphonate transport system substrate-binding protein
VQILILGLICLENSVADSEKGFAFFNAPTEHYQPSFSPTSPFPSQIYTVGIHPLHNPKRLFEIYAPLITLFNQAMPDVTFELESSRNYEEFEKKLYTGHFDFALPNPYQTINAMKHGYHVFAKMGDDADFRGLILVRTDAGINRISDLKGKTISYPAPTALAATLMPQYYLQTHGLNINTDVENIYVGSQESSIMNVLNRKVAAGATWTVPWRAFVKNQPQLAEQLEVKWETESFVNNSWMAKETMPQNIIQKINAILLNLPKTQEGQAILAAIPLSKFEAANDEIYKPIQAFVTKFDKTVRPLQ